jgi:hypothetical protein
MVLLVRRLIRKPKMTDVRVTAFMDLRVRSLWLLLCVLWLCTNSGSMTAQSNRQISVDLKAGTLNGRPIVDWTLDGVTNELGRPTAVTDGVAGILGAQLHYHPQGISLWFQAKEKDPAQHIFMATIYLARSWDREHTAWYQVFPGVMAPAVDRNWKQSRLENEFASFHPTVKTVEESKRELEKSGVPGLANSATNDFVSVIIGRLGIGFALEPNTKFLERIVLNRRDSTAK